MKNNKQNYEAEKVPKAIVLSIFIFVLFPYFSNFSQAAISKQINYQGKLTDVSNVAVADGNYDMIISLYTASSGGTPIWTARGTIGSPTARSVALENGIFSIMLGDTVAGDNAIDLDFNLPYYLGVTIGTDSEMSPRKPIGATGYAFNADLLDGLNSATSGDNAHILATDSSGNITVSGNAYFANGTTYYVNNLGTGNLNGLTLVGDLAVNGNDINSTGALTVTPNAGANFNLALSGTGDFAVNTSQFYIDTSTGNIGIGTIIPTAFLDISPGTITTDAFRIAATDLNNTFQLKIQGHTGGDSHAQIVTGSSNSRLSVMAGDSTDSAPRFSAIGAQDSTVGIRGWALFDYGSGLYDLPDAKFIVRYSNTGGLTEMISVISSSKVTFPNGNIGIGTSNPNSKLSVIAAGNISSQVQISSVDEDSGMYLTSAAANNGFISAGAKYESGSGWVAKNGSGAGNAWVFGGGSSGMSWFYDTGLTSGNVYTPTTVLKIQTNGNVGIGTTDPGHALEVNGAIAIGDGTSQILPIITGDTPTASSYTRLFVQPESGNQIMNAFYMPSGTQDESSIQVRNSNDLSNYGRLMININGPETSIIAESTGTGPAPTKLSLGLGSLGSVNDLVILDSGNVGIGTISPQAKLDVSGDISASTIGLNLPSGYVQTTPWASMTNGPDIGGMNIISNGTYGMLALQSYSDTNWHGNFFMSKRAQGTYESPTAVVDGNNIFNLDAFGYNGSDFVRAAQVTALVDGTPSGGVVSGKWNFLVNNSAGTLISALTIKSTGNVGIGTVSPGYILTVNGQPGANGYTAFTNYSDVRLKENVASLKDGYLDKIMQLNPASFNYNSLSGYNEETRNRKIFGFIAQEMQNIFPEMVGHTSINGKDYLDTNLSSLPVYMVKAIQEQQLQIEDAKNSLQGINLKTDQNVTTVAQLQEYFDLNLGNISKGLAVVSDRIINLETSLEVFDSQFLDITSRLYNQENITISLQAQIDEIKRGSISDLSLAKVDLNSVDIELIKQVLGFESVLNPGDISLTGIITTEGVESKKLTIINIEKGKETIGSAKILAVKKDDNEDGIDDDTGSDGKSIVVETLEIYENSKIYITPNDSTGNQVPFVDNIVEFESFEIKFDEPVGNDVKISWWIVDTL